MVTSSDFDNSSESTLTLSDGQNKINKGGTYYVTGSTSNGYIIINTSENVKLILDNVSIARSDGSPVHIKGGASVLIEFIGDNTLTSTETGDDPSAAISSQGSVTISGSGSATLKSNGKGIKADGELLIENGKLDISAVDDAVHSNTNVAISGGEITATSSDDGVHADETVTISGGKLNVTKSYEGIEGTNITVSGGEVSLVSSDDGFNVSGGNDQSGGNGGPMQGGGAMDADSGGVLTISGGNVYVNAAGDGLDSNGSIIISGGTVYVDGPTDNGNGALDYNGKMEISGGTLIAVGSSGMAQNATSASQPSVLINLTSSYKDSFTFGEITYSPKKSYSSILISSDKLKTGASYDLKISGNTVQTVAVSQNVTTSGSASGTPGNMPVRAQGTQYSDSRRR